MQIEDNQLNHLEALQIKINNQLTITTLYSPPNQQINSADFHYILNKPGRQIIIGDLNAKHTLWHCRTIDRKGLALFNIINNSNSQIISPNEPTHYPTNGNSPSTIDIAVVKNITGTATALNALNSDHLPVKFELHFKLPLPVPPQNKLLNYKHANWDLFRAKLHEATEVPISIENSDELEQEVSKLTLNVQSAIRASIKQSTPKVKQDIDQSIVTKIKRRNALRRRFQRTRDPNQMQKFSQLSLEIAQDIKEHKNNEWRKVLAKLTTSDGSIWKVLKSMKNPQNTIAPLKTAQNQMHFDAKEKANLLASNFAAISRNSPNFTPQQHKIETRVTSFIELAKSNTSSLFITAKELNKIIKNLPPKKAPGPDGIQNIVIKNFPRKTKAHLLAILNAMFRLKHFPSAWKKAVVIPIQKANTSKFDPNSYRPISLLNALAKIAEKAINTKLELEIQHTLIDEQFGFRAGHSTTHQLARVVTDTKLAWNRKMFVHMALLDIEKAFDTV